MPPPPEEYFSRYGKILSLSDQPPYPFKLTMPFPGVGEIKVPSKEELDIRQKAGTARHALRRADPRSTGEMARLRQDEFGR